MKNNLTSIDDEMLDLFFKSNLKNASNYCYKMGWEKFKNKFELYMRNKNSPFLTNTYIKGNFSLN